jgi:hypothetical protein
VELEWVTVSGATGYRVVRSDEAGALLGLMVELDVTTGRATAAAGVTNVWSEQHTYLPAGGTLGSPDTSSRIRYVDVGPGRRCYRVVAFNAAGDADPSPVACGSPP